MKNIINTYEALLWDKQERLEKRITNSDIENRGIKDSEENRTKLAVLDAEIKVLNAILTDLKRVDKEGN